jgi:hypothetical protein
MLSVNVEPGNTAEREICWSCHEYITEYELTRITIFLCESATPMQEAQLCPMKSNEMTTIQSSRVTSLTFVNAMHGNIALVRHSPLVGIDDVGAAATAGPDVYAAAPDS